MTTQNVVWTHQNRWANERGLVSGQIGGETDGDHVVMFGGFCTGIEESASNASSSLIGASYLNKNTTDPLNGTPATPMVGSQFAYDAGADRSYGMCTFAAPPGTYVRVHMWAVIG